MNKEQVIQELHPGYLSPNCMFALLLNNPDNDNKICEEAYAIDRGEVAKGINEQERTALGLIGIAYGEAYRKYTENNSRSGNGRGMTYEQKIGKFRSILFSELPPTESDFLQKIENDYYHFVASKRGE